MKTITGNAEHSLQRLGWNQRLNGEIIGRYLNFRERSVSLVGLGVAPSHTLHIAWAITSMEVKIYRFDSLRASTLWQKILVSVSLIHRTVILINHCHIVCCLNRQHWQTVGFPGCSFVAPLQESSFLEFTESFESKIDITAPPKETLHGNPAAKVFRISSSQGKAISKASDRASFTSTCP
jgi:hypothetical protein